MSHRPYAAAVVALSILWCGGSALADSLRCQSVNGNLNCASPGGASCQTVNGKTVCVSGHDDAVQSFGKNTSSDAHDDDVDNDRPDTTPAKPAPKQRLEQRSSLGHTLVIQRDGTKLHLQTDSISVDRD